MSLESGRPGAEPGPASESGSEAEFAAALRDLLRSSERQLDFNATTRLAAARARAMAEADAARRAPAWFRAVPAGAFAATVIAVVAMWALLPAGFHGPSTAPQTLQSAALSPADTPETLDVLSDDGASLAVSEDLDFYQWLDDADGSV